MPEIVRDGFSSAMAQSTLLPAVVLAIGFIASLCFTRPVRKDEERPAEKSQPAGADPRRSPVDHCKHLYNSSVRGRAWQ